MCVLITDGFPRPSPGEMPPLSATSWRNSTQTRPASSRRRSDAVASKSPRGGRVPDAATGRSTGTKTTSLHQPQPEPRLEHHAEPPRQLAHPVLADADRLEPRLGARSYRSKERPKRPNAPTSDELWAVPAEACRRRPDLLGIGRKALREKMKRLRIGGNANDTSNAETQ